MKRLLISTILLFIASTAVFAQNQTADDIAALLKTGDSNGLSAYFMSNVDLAILDTDDVYSKTQATQITKKFFAEHAPSAFSVKHQGKSKLDDHYRIGTLNTAAGDFRVTYFLKSHNGKYLIKQLRIESNNRE